MLQVLGVNVSDHLFTLTLYVLFTSHGVSVADIRFLVNTYFSLSKTNSYHPIHMSDNQELEKLVGREADRHTGFTQLRRKAFLEHYAQNKHIGKACQSIGIDRMTYNRAVKLYPEFRQSILDIVNFICDDKEQTMIESGDRPGKDGFMDRIAYLRAHRPELYGNKVEVTNSDSGLASLRHRVGDYKDRAIEAEVVSDVALPSPELPSSLSTPPEQGTE
jgi:hypothetical protein